MQTREKAGGIASENGSLFQIIQLGAFQDPWFRVYSQVSTEVRKISTKQNLINPDYVAQHSKHGITCRKSRIPIHAAKHVSSGTSLLAARDETHLVDDRKTRGEKWDRTSRVREDVLHVWCAGEPIRVMQLSDGTI